jgi:ribosomal protein L37AE/L43A
MSEMADRLMIACPQCGTEQEDLDGFGFLYCDRCGYCTHSSVDGVTCSMCLRDVEGDEE